MEIVTLGNVCIDKNNIEGRFYENAGGPATFMSLFFNKAKDVAFSTIVSYGADFLPYKNGLNLFPKSPNLSKSLVYENIVLNGKRNQKCHFYKDALPPVIDENITKIVEKADVLFITPLVPYFSPDYVKKIVKVASKNCLKILLPQGYFRDFDKNENVIFREFKEADEIFPLVDVVILSNEDYPNAELLSIGWNKKYHIIYIITKGELGAQIVKDGTTNQIPTAPISSFNSIGAGDIFSAAFGYYYLKTKDLTKSVKLANQTAGKKLLNG